MNDNSFRTALDAGHGQIHGATFDQISEVIMEGLPQQVRLHSTKQKEIEDETICKRLRRGLDAELTHAMFKRGRAFRYRVCSRLLLQCVCKTGGVQIHQHSKLRHTSHSACVGSSQYEEALLPECLAFEEDSPYV